MTMKKIAVTEVMVTITLPNCQTYSVRELQPDWLDLEHNLGSVMLRRCAQIARDREGLAADVLVGP